jgi:peptidoglycan/LPS O-acetylase OafA/YrhL
MFKLGRRPALTGLRCPIILILIAGHATFGWKSNVLFMGGWDAVSVFFVLSGFLITLVLIESKDKNNKIKLAEFYRNRAIRLLPPVFFVILGLILFSIFSHVPNSGSRLWGEVWATLFYYQDFRYAAGHIPFLGYLAQSWSLSVEEQYYFLWALLTFFVYKAYKEKGLLICALCGFLAAVFWRLYLVLFVLGSWKDGKSYVRLYYSFDTRIDAILLGCIIALLFRLGVFEKLKAKTIRRFSIVAMLAFIIEAYLAFYLNAFYSSTYIWGLLLTEICAGIIITYLVLRPNSVGGRILSVKPMVLIGNLSYSLYLIHWPVDLIVNTGIINIASWQIQVVRLLITFSLAGLLWIIIESPLANWKHNHSFKAVHVGVAE